jgi:ethanolamine ammonia-lyase small subunit
LTPPKLALVTPPPSRMSALREATEARIALGRSGAGLPTRAAQSFLLDHAHARQAVWSPLDSDGLQASLEALGYHVAHAASNAIDRAEYLRRPDLGRSLSDTSRETLLSLGSDNDIAIVIADGLSAKAVELNAIPVIVALGPLLAEAGLTVSTITIATQARVALADGVGVALGARASLILVGERPGLSAADSLGAYLTYAPKPGLPDSSRNCISNIRDGGLQPADAARQISEILVKMMRHGVSGVALEAIRGDEINTLSAIPQ